MDFCPAVREPNYWFYNFTYSCAYIVAGGIWLIGMIAIFVAVGNTLLNAGLTQSLIRTENPEEEDYSTVFYFNLASSILVYALVFLLPLYLPVILMQFGVAECHLWLEQCLAHPDTL